MRTGVSVSLSWLFFYSDPHILGKVPILTVCISSRYVYLSVVAKKKEKSSSDISSNKFQVTTCVGHNDLVVAVSTDGEVLLSGR